MFSVPCTSNPPCASAREGVALVDLHDYVRLLRQNWLLLVVAAILGTLVSSGLITAATPEYSSTARLYVSVPAQESSASIDLNQGSNFARQAVASFVDVADSQVVLRLASQKLDGALSPGDLAARVTASSPANTVLIEVTATDVDPARASKIANAVSAAFTQTVTGELERPSGGGESLIRISTVQKATPPAAPSSPKVPLMLGLGFVSGLALGLVVAVLRTLLDTKVRTVQQLESVSGKPFLGGLYRDPGADQCPLIVHSAPRDPKSEAFRRLRTNLQFVEVGGAHKSIVVTSSGPGESKTYTASNLAIALAETGAKVVIVDADLRRPRVAHNFGVESAAGVTDVLIGRAELDDVLHAWGSQGLAVLPSGQIPPNPSEMLGSESMRALVDELEKLFDYVIFDAPPVLLVADAAVLSRFAGVVFVTATGKARKADVDAALRALESVGAKVLGVVAGLLPVRGPDAQSYGKYAYYTQPGQAEVPELIVEERRSRRAAAR